MNNIEQEIDRIYAEPEEEKQYELVDSLITNESLEADSTFVKLFLHTTQQKIENIIE